MNKPISMREMILLGILIILAAYYFVVQGPIAKETQQLEAEKAEIELRLDEAQTKLTQKKAMEAELEKVFEESNGKPNSLPDYNNINNVINELHAILDSAVSYNITFGDDEEDSYIVRRDIKITYKVRSYKDATARLDAIRKSSNGYLLEDVSITETDSRIVNSPDQEVMYSVSLNMISFDYKAEK